MKYIFTENAGNKDFQEELVELLNEKYHSIVDFFKDLKLNNNEMYVERHNKDSIILFSVSIIDVKNMIIYVDCISIGG